MAGSGGNSRVRNRKRACAVLSAVLVCVLLPAFAAAECRCRAGGENRAAVAKTRSGEAAFPKRSAVPPDALPLRLGVGETRDLKPMLERGSGGADWRCESLNPKIAAVSGNGAVTALRKGNALIRCSADTGETMHFSVKVLAAPGSVRLSAGQRVLHFDAERGIAQQTVLRVTLPGKTASAVLLYGYDTSVLTVAPDGTVTPAGLGTTTVRAVTFNGLVSGCRITVCEPERRCGGSVAIAAHRGVACCGPEKLPEKLRQAAADGATAVDLDVRSTADGVQIVSHDPTFKVGKTKVSVRKREMQQIRQLQPEICTLDEVLDEVMKTDLEILLEMKDTADVNACVRAVCCRGLLRRTVFKSFRPMQLMQVRSAAPSARLGLMMSKKPSGLNGTIAALKPEYLFQKGKYLREGNLYAWQDQGLKVGVWLINKPKDAERWLEKGVDCVTSDCPKAVAEAVRIAKRAS